MITYFRHSQNLVKEGFRNEPKLQTVEKNRLQELFVKSVKDLKILVGGTDTRECSGMHL